MRRGPWQDAKRVTIYPTDADLRLMALAWAQSQIGICEAPLGSNKTPYGAEYSALGDYDYNGQAWCAILVCLSYSKVGLILPVMQYGTYPGAAKVDYLRAGYEDRGWIVTDPKPGDTVFFTWSHVGILERVDGDYYSIVEGNTCLDGGSSDESWYVMRHTRHKSKIAAFGRPRRETT